VGQWFVYHFGNNISEQQRPEKCVHVTGVNGLFSINGTQQADKILPLIYSQVGYKVFGVV